MKIIKMSIYNQDKLVGYITLTKTKTWVDLNMRIIQKNNKPIVKNMTKLFEDSILTINKNGLGVK